MGGVLRLEALRVVPGQPAGLITDAHHYSRAAWSPWHPEPSKLVQPRGQIHPTARSCNSDFIGTLVLSHLHVGQRQPLCCSGRAEWTDWAANRAENTCCLALCRPRLSACSGLWLLPPSELCAYWVSVFILKYLNARCWCYCNCIILTVNYVTWWNKRSKGVLLWEILLVVPEYPTSLPLVIESQVSAGRWPPAIELHFLDSLASDTAMWLRSGQWEVGGSSAHRLQAMTSKGEEVSAVPFFPSLLAAVDCGMEVGYWEHLSSKMERAWVYNVTEIP